MRPSSVKETARALAEFRAAVASLDRPGPRPDPRLPLGIERLLLKLFGRPIRCAGCGREMFVGLPLVWRGELWLIGAYDHQVRVSWTSSQTMELRHALLDECPAPERPWVL
jgi:hypothetical protein